MIIEVVVDEIFTQRLNYFLGSSFIRWMLFNESSVYSWPFCHSFIVDTPQKHKKKKKDRDRDRHRDKEDRPHKHRHHSSSHSSHSERRSISAPNGDNPRPSSSQSVPAPTVEQDSKCPNAIDEPLVTTENTSMCAPAPAKQQCLNKPPTTDYIPQNKSPIKQSPDSTTQFDLRDPIDVAPSTNQNIISSSTNQNNSMLGSVSSAVPHCSNDYKVFAPSIKSPMTVERTPTEGAGIVIKKDYLPSPAKVMKLEKTRDDVTRVLNYDAESTLPRTVDKSASYPSMARKMDPITVSIKIEPPDSAGKKHYSILNENKENKGTKVKLDYLPKKPSNEVSRIKVAHPTIAAPHKPAPAAEGIAKKPADKHSSSSSSHHTKSVSGSKSSSRRSSSSSNRDCSRCYKRSKIKRVHTGIQCRRTEEALKDMTPSSTPMKLTHLANDKVEPDEALSQFKYARFFHVEVHSNGGASIVHMYQNEIDSLPPEELEELVDEYFQLVFSEDEDGFAHHVMGIVHDAAAYLPDLLEHMADNYSTLTVKAGVLGRNSDIETSTMSQYYEQVSKQYAQGTFRYGPLHQISLVGKVHEEVGGYFPDLLGRLEQSPFLKKVC